MFWYCIQKSNHSINREQTHPPSCFQETFRMSRSFYPVLTVLSLSLCTFLNINSHSQVPGKDILHDNHVIGNSAELFTIRIENDTVEFRIFDAVGNINQGGIVEKEKKYILENDWQSFKYGSPVSILSGNFDGDRYTDVVAAWEARDTNIAMYIPKIETVSVK